MYLYLLSKFCSFEVEVKLEVKIFNFTAVKLEVEVKLFWEVKLEVEVKIS